MRRTSKLAFGIVVAVGVAASGVVRADDEFRVQAQLAYDKVSFDDDAGDADTIGVNGTFYFKPVPTAGVPVGEAAYIARSSYVDVQYQKADFDTDDIEALSADVGYHFPNSIFFARVGVVNTDVPDALGDGDTTWNGTLGVVPIPRLFFGTDFTEDGYDPNITARYVGKLANNNWWAGSVHIIDVDEGDTDFDVNFDYYFPKFKVGGAFNSNGDVWTARAEVGLPNGFALLGRIYTADGADGFGVTLTWRDL